jgi:hypothetical protein
MDNKIPITCVWLWSHKKHRWYLAWRGPKDKIQEGWKLARQKFPNASGDKFEESQFRPRLRWD